MTASGDGTTLGGQAPVWCGACGIPYAAGTVSCAHCGAMLAPVAPSPATAASAFAPAIAPALAEGAPSPTAASPNLAGDEDTSGTTPAPVMSATAPLSLDQTYPRPPRGLFDRVRQGQRAMSEAEVDAAAAAIIAQARSAGEPLSGEAASPDSLPLLVGLLPDFAVDEALQRRQARERFWLIAGIVCSVLLILLALAISRYLSTGLLRH